MNVPQTESVTNLLVTSSAKQQAGFRNETGALMPYCTSLILFDGDSCYYPYCTGEHKHGSENYVDLGDG